MAKNDYYLLACRILITYLYNCLKSDVELDITEWLEINKCYFGYILNKAYDIDMA